MASDFDYRFSSLPPETRGIEQIERAREKRPAIGADKAEGAFATQLGQAIGQLDRLQTDADVQADAIANGGGNLHEVALAFEKADVAMRLATKVRNKVVDIYNEIMRMSV